MSDVETRERRDSTVPPAVSLWTIRGRASASRRARPRCCRCCARVAVEQLVRWQLVAAQGHVRVMCEMPVGKVASGVADAVPVAEEVEADGALAADLERISSGTMQVQGRITLSSHHQHSVTMSSPGSHAQSCS